MGRGKVENTRNQNLKTAFFLSSIEISAGDADLSRGKAESARNVRIEVVFVGGMITLNHLR